MSKPDFVEHWPIFKFKEIDNCTRRFVVEEVPKTFDTVLLVVNCGENKCIKRIGKRFTNVAYTENKKGEMMASIRFAPIFDGFGVDLVLEESGRLHVDVAFVPERD